jgi:hypothetical protein
LAESLCHMGGIILAVGVHRGTGLGFMS